MSDKSGEPTWIVGGVQIQTKVIPDHQLESVERISEDSLRLFRIALVVLSVFITLFGFLLRSGPSVVFQVYQNDILFVGLFCFLLSLGGTFSTYGISNRSVNNYIASTKYIDLQKRGAPVGDKEKEDESLLYEYYWEEAADFGGTVRNLQRMVSISAFSLYVAVIYTPIGFLKIYASVPDWLIVVALAGPMVIVMAIAKLFGLLGDYEGPVLVPEAIRGSQQGDEE